MTTKIINPCTCDINGKFINAFAKIKWDGIKLSITSVIGPRPNGAAIGNCGQCINDVRQGRPNETDGWTTEMLNQLCDIWAHYHLNNMRPECEHQRKAGWNELAQEKVTLYHYEMNDTAIKKRHDAEAAALNALRQNKSFTPTEEQHFFAVLPFEIVVTDPLSETNPMQPYYEPKKNRLTNMDGSKEITTRQNVFFNEHPDVGILCKPCPVCGYEYGSKWLTEKVPQSVIDWLFALPDSKIEPCWI